MVWCIAIIAALALARSWVHTPATNTAVMVSHLVLVEILTHSHEEGIPEQHFHHKKAKELIFG